MGNFSNGIDNFFKTFFGTIFIGLGLAMTIGGAINMNPIAIVGIILLFISIKLLKSSNKKKSLSNSNSTTSSSYRNMSGQEKMRLINSNAKFVEQDQYLCNCSRCGKSTMTVVELWNTAQGRKRYIQCPMCGNEWLL
jgi:DNA-directed RNA polymerase subunit RPC12/RpoP